MSHTSRSFYHLETTKTNQKFSSSAFKERWFKLRSNLLFYYPKNVANSRTAAGSDQEPTGALLMENFVTIRDNENLPNTFSISKCWCCVLNSISYSLLPPYYSVFLAEPEVKYFFFCMNSRQSNEWFEQLSQVSYRQQRITLSSLRAQIRELTGKDPLEASVWSDKL